MHAHEVHVAATQAVGGVEWGAAQGVWELSLLRKGRGAGEEGEVGGMPCVLSAWVLCCRRHV